jgi:hypothetical protein
MNNPTYPDLCRMSTEATDALYSAAYRFRRLSAPDRDAARPALMTAGRLLGAIRDRMNSDAWPCAPLMLTTFRSALP